MFNRVFCLPAFMMPKASMRSIPLILALLPTMASAHVDPVYPVQIDLKVYTDQALVEIEAAAHNWREDASFPDVPPSEWNEAMMKIARQYNADHFKLTVDGNPINPESLSVKYFEEVWSNAEEGGRLRFTMKYPFPPGQWRLLNGRCSFFDRAYRPPEKRPAGIPMDFFTVLKIPGRVPRLLKIPYEQPDFQVPYPEAQRSWTQRCVENFLRGMRYPITEPASILFLTAMILHVFHPKKDIYTSKAAYGPILLVSSFLLSSIIPNLDHYSAQCSLILNVSVILSAGTAVLGLPDDRWMLATAAGIGAIGGILRIQALAPIAANPGLPFQLCFLAGTVSCFSMLFAILWAGLRAHRGQLRQDSVARSDEMLLSHIRFGEKLMVLVSFYQIIHKLTHR